jgi:hypothetical protein
MKRAARNNVESWLALTDDDEDEDEVPLACQ